MKFVASGEETTSTSIVLVHAHALFREGLRHHLESVPDFRITGEASNGQQAIQLVDYTDPDLVLMAVDLPGEIRWCDRRGAIIQESELPALRRRVRRYDSR